MNANNCTYQFFFPNFFASQHDFVKHSKNPDRYEEFCLGKDEYYFHDEENKGFSRKLHGVSTPEKFRREYFWNEFRNWTKWRQAGSNIFSFSRSLLQLLSFTDVENVELASLKFPYNNFYLSLRSLELPFAENEPNLIDGVYINIATRDRRDQDATYEFALTLDFAGDYEKFALRYNDSISQIFDYNFKNFTLFLDKKAGIMNVHQALAEHKEFFREEIVITNEDKAIDVFQFNQQLIERTIRIVINCLLYLSLPDKDVKQDFPTDLPAYLISKNTRAKTRRKKEVAEQEIEQRGFTKINFVGERFVHHTNEKKNATSDGSPHWRRGHWRNQRHGIALKESRLIWIRPTIVNEVMGTPKKGHIYITNTNPS